MKPEDMTDDQVLSEIRRIIIPITDDMVGELREQVAFLESELVAANEATEHKSALVHLRDREVFDLRRDLKIANELNDRLRAELQRSNDKRVVFIGGTAQGGIDALRERLERTERISQERGDLLEEARKGYDSLKSALHHPYKGKDER